MAPEMQNANKTNERFSSPFGTRHGDMCLDYNYNNNNVYMHKCHGGDNQEWWFDGRALKTKRDDNLHSFCILFPKHANRMTSCRTNLCGKIALSIQFRM